MKNLVKLAAVTIVAMSVIFTAVVSATTVSVANATYVGEVADAAFLVEGNDDVAKIDDLNFSSFGTGNWSLLDKTDGGSTAFNNVTFSLTASDDNNDKTFDYTLSWSASDPVEDLPIIMDFVLVDKSGNNFIAYMFDEKVFTAAPLTGTGTFTLSIHNNGNQIADNSHVSLYGRLGTTIPTVEVPEPTSLILLSLSVIGLSLGRRILAICK